MHRIDWAASQTTSLFKKRPQQSHPPQPQDILIPAVLYHIPHHVATNLTVTPFFGSGKVYYREKGGYMERKKLHNLCLFSKQYQEAGTLAVRQAYTQVSVHIHVFAFWAA